MYAVLVQVQLDRNKRDEVMQNLNELVPQVKAAPGFATGTWFGDVDAGYGLMTFQNEQQARQVASTIASNPDDPVQVIDVKVSSTGFDGGFQLTLSGCSGEGVASVGGLVLDGRDETDLPVEPAEVEPVDVLGYRDLKVVDALPRSAVADQFGLEQAVERLGHGVVVGISFASDGRDGAGFREAFGVSDGDILDTAI